MPESLNIRNLLRPYAGLLGLALLAVLGEGIAGLLEPWPLKIVFDTVSGSKPLPDWIRRMLPIAATADRMTILEIAALTVIAIAAIEALCSYVEKYTTTEAGQWVMHDLRRMVYNHVQHLSLGYHTQKRTGDLISRITSDVDTIQNFIVSNLLGLIVDVLTLAGMAGVMFWLNWRFTLIALTVAPVLFAVTWFFTRRSKQASREVRQKEGEMASLMQEVLSAISVVKAFAREDYEQERLEKESAESVKLALHARSLKAKLAPAVGMVVAAGTALVLWYGGRLVVTGKLSAGSLIVFIWYLGKMYKPMQDFAKMTDSFTKAAVGYDRVREILETPAAVRDLPSAIVAPELRGAIEFDDVQFGYDAARPVLRDINLKAEAGHMTALVGPTGSGKTSLVALLARLYDPSRGAVLIDGADLRSVDVRSLRSQVAFVADDSFLFSASVAENIAYARPDASLEEIELAARRAQAHGFIEGLPDGYETRIGERGLTLSGGQRQRVAIARALLAEPRILILDDATSSVDARTEAAIKRGLREAMAGRTTFIVAHRMSTISLADEVVVMEGGRIIDQGTHNELVERCTLYAEIAEHGMEDSVFLQRDLERREEMARL